MFAKLPYLFVFLLLAALSAAAQESDQSCLPPDGSGVLLGNEVRAQILTGGDLFWDGNDSRFQVPYQANGPATIFAQGLWLGAIDPGGNLKLAAQSYGRGQASNDYWPGPLNAEGLTDEAACSNWDRIFSVYRHQIEAHRADFADNGVVDNPLAEILGWPGQGNPHFSGIYGFDLPDTPQGLAPFADENQNGIYDPLAGDYPVVPQALILPEQITWCVFNDAGNIHSSSLGDPLRAEIQLTTWALNCTDNPQLRRTVFTSYKVINRGIEPLDSLHLGLWLDFDLGCHIDDFLGSAPELATFFAYNQDNLDGETNGSCPNGVIPYGVDPPVQAVSILNKELTNFMYFNAPSMNGIPPATMTPQTPAEAYNFLTGRWRDGTPLTPGGTGYNPNSNDPPVNFAFPNDPNDPEGWSEFTAGTNALPSDRRALGSIRLNNLMPGTLDQIDIAYTFFREEGNDYLENVTALYEGIAALHDWYDDGFATACSQEAICQDDCVWPGDLNADGIANHCDLLAIGLGNGASGPTRPAPYNWSPRDGQPWAGQQTNGANDKHLDANGDGTAAFDDFFLTEQHYNLTRPGYQPPAPEYREGPELLLDSPLPSFDFENLSAGQNTVLGRIQLAAVPELYALSFSLEYDTAYFEIIEGLPSGYELEERTFASGSAVGAPSGQFDYARAATEDVVEGGRLLVLRIATKEEFLYPLPADTTLIRFKNIKAIRSDGTEIEIGGTTVVARFQGVMVSTEEASADRDIQLFPNPANGRVELRFPGQQLGGIQLFDSAGRQVWQRRATWRDAAAFELGSLPPGLYFLRLQLASGTVIRKLVLQP